MCLKHLPQKYLMPKLFALHEPRSSTHNEFGVKLKNKNLSKARHSLKKKSADQLKIIVKTKPPDITKESTGAPLISL